MKPSLFAVATKAPLLTTVSTANDPRESTHAGLNGANIAHCYAHAYDAGGAVDVACPPQSSSSGWKKSTPGKFFFSHRRVVVHNLPPRSLLLLIFLLSAVRL